MTNNSYTPPSHSPFLPAEEDGEWVRVWVPRTALPSPQVGTLESQFPTSPLSAQFGTPTTVAQSFYPSPTWDQPQMPGPNDFFSSPTSTSPLNSTPFSGSPVDQLFDDFDIDAAFQDANPLLANDSLFGLADHSLLSLGDENFSSAPLTDQNVVDAELFNAFVDFSGVDLGLDFGLGAAPAVIGALTPSTAAAGSPTSSTQGLEGFGDLALYSSIPLAATPDLTQHSSILPNTATDSTPYSSVPITVTPDSAGYSPIPIGTSPGSSISSPPSTSPSAQGVFPCSHSYCNHVFDRSADLRRHERKHRRNFACDLCGKGHIDQRGLGRHMWAQHKTEAKKRNTRSEMIKCTECDYEGRSDNVARHIKTKHGPKK